jgi:hypothetical protein
VAPLSSPGILLRCGVDSWVSALVQLDGVTLGPRITGNVVNGTVSDTAFTFAFDGVDIDSAAASYVSVGVLSGDSLAGTTTMRAPLVPGYTETLTGAWSAERVSDTPAGAQATGLPSFRRR